MTRPSGSNKPGLGVKHDESDHALDPPDGDVVAVYIPIVKRPPGRPPRDERFYFGVAMGNAVVDLRDAGLAEIRWRLTPQGYAMSCALGLMHRHILGLRAGDGLEVDHINGNKLDCRRANMRVVTHRQNTHNVPSRGGSSKHRGVSWNESRQVWEAYVQVDGRKRHLGRFEDELTAAEAAARGRDLYLTHHNEDRSVAHV